MCFLTVISTWLSVQLQWIAWKDSSIVCPGNVFAVSKLYCKLLICDQATEIQQHPACVLLTNNINKANSHAVLCIWISEASLRWRMAAHVHVYNPHYTLALHSRPFMLNSPTRIACTWDVYFLNVNRLQHKTKTSHSTQYIVNYCTHIIQINVSSSNIIILPLAICNHVSVQSAGHLCETVSNVTDKVGNFFQNFGYKF